MKDIKKYVSYYLLVYLVVLAICGFFQYFTVCQGKSLECLFSTAKINTIITTTAYVLTPIVAIIGFLSWKVEKQYDLEKHQAEKLIKFLNEANLQVYREYCLIKPLYLILEQIIIIPSLKHQKTDLSRINDFDIFQQELELLNKVLDMHNQIDMLFLENFYLHFKFFNASLREIKNQYFKNYHILIKDDSNNPEHTKIIDLNNTDPHFNTASFIHNNAGRRLQSERLQKILTAEKIKITITDPLSKEVKESNKTFEEYKEDYDLSFNALIEELVKVIKPHKKPPRKAVF